MYAMGEIALVVIGILIALQINNWNEWRKEMENTTSILKNAQTYIKAEIVKEESESQKLLGWVDTLHKTYRIIEEKDSLTLSDQKLLESAFRDLVKLGLRSRNVSTLEELSASISKSKLRSKTEVLSHLPKLAVLEIRS